METSASVLGGSRGEADGDGERQVQAKGRAVKAVVSLDSLPTELLRLIAEGVFGPSKSPTSLRPLMLNKRIFAVALEVWYEYWALDDHDLEMLVCADEKVRLLVRRLDFVPASQSLLVFQKEMLVLRTFTRVTTFALYGKLGSSTKPHLPAALCRVLTTFKYLTSLTLDLQTRFVLSDTDFSIGRDLPRLQQLHLGPNCACARQLLRFPCPSLRHLDLAYNNEGEEDDVYPVIPWSSLVSLDIYLGTGTADFRPLERFNKSLQLALFPHQNQFGPPASLPLRSLRIHDQLFRPDSLNDSSKDALEQLSMHSFGRLLELLGCTSIAHLQLYPHYALRIPVDMPVLASLPSLELRNSKLDLSEEEHLTALFNLLHLFPNLCYLRLKRAIFAPFVDAVERQLHPPDSLAFLTRHPSLSALLHALSATNILQFTWYAKPESYTWTRSSTSERFRGGEVGAVLSEPG